jgi:sodium-dependent dicarboxylate transporter 2/3/5
MSKKIGLIIGPLLFICCYSFIDFDGLSSKGIAIAASTLWIALWWVTEAIPIAITSLLPIILFPLTGALSMKETVLAYSHPIIYLFIGGFVLALAIEKCMLHKRIAINIIYQIGDSKNKIILGIMLACAFLSMWISNTATTVMMLPIGMAIVKQVKCEQKDFSVALMLSIAFSASIGGIATLIGTPPNLILAANIQEQFQVEIGFIEWMKIGLPFALIMLIICWLYLTKIAFHFGDKKRSSNLSIKDELNALGRLSYDENRVALVFIFTSLAWITRSYLQNFLPYLNDSIIALTALFMLFLLPSKSKTNKLMSWKEAEKLPWGVLLLFGGGIAIANGFSDSGLAVWLGGHFNLLKDIEILIVLVAIIASVNFLTEITSNLATTSVVLPILIPLSLVINVHPYILMIGATIAASCAFMLPAATPPNAIVFGSGLVTIKDMMRVGLWLNIISILLLSILAYFLVPFVFDLSIIKTV